MQPEVNKSKGLNVMPIFFHITTIFVEEDVDYGYSKFLYHKVI